MVSECELSLCSAEVNPRKIALLEHYLVPGSCIDLGCGNGLYGGSISRICTDLLQVDIADRRNEEARCFPFRQMDIGQVDMEGELFENVVAFDLMEHLDDDDRFLRYVRRICSRRFIFSVPNDDDAQLRSVGLTFMHHVDKTHRRQYTRDGLADLLLNHGFKILAIEGQHTDGLLRAPLALADKTLRSRIVSHILFVQMKVFEKMGFLHNDSVADWLCVSEVTK